MGEFDWLVGGTREYAAEKDRRKTIFWHLAGSKNTINSNIFTLD